MAGVHRSHSVFNAASCARIFIAALRTIIVLATRRRPALRRSTSFCSCSAPHRIHVLSLAGGQTALKVGDLILLLRDFVFEAARRGRPFARWSLRRARAGPLNPLSPASRSNARREKKTVLELPAICAPSANRIAVESPPEHQSRQRRRQAHEHAEIRKTGASLFSSSRKRQTPKSRWRSLVSWKRTTARSESFGRHVSKSWRTAS